MNKKYTINLILLIMTLMAAVFAAGCGGGGNSVSSQATSSGETATGPSIKLEGEIDPASLWADTSLLSAPGASRAGAAAPGG